MMILYAASKLKQNTSETSAVSFKTSEIQPTTKTQQTNAQSVSFSPETSLDKGTQRKTTENELPSLTQCTA